MRIGIVNYGRYNPLSVSFGNTEVQIEIANLNDQKFLCLNSAICEYVILLNIFNVGGRG